MDSGSITSEQQALFTSRDLSNLIGSLLFFDIFVGTYCELGALSLSLVQLSSVSAAFPDISRRKLRPPHKTREWKKHILFYSRRQLQKSPLKLGSRASSRKSRLPLGRRDRNDEENRKGETRGKKEEMAMAMAKSADAALQRRLEVTHEQCQSRHKF